MTHSTSSSPGSVSVRQLLEAARARVDPIDAQWLLLDLVDRPAGWLISQADARVDPDLAQRYLELVERRANGEPVAYLTGRRGFWSLDLHVSNAVLIPRPETELLVELALEHLPPSQRWSVADLGTGSGAVALALAQERPDCLITAVDVSAQAVAVARANVERLGVGNVHVVQGHWYRPLAGQRFDVIVSNPPYLPVSDPHLEQGDLRHEPVLALVSGVDGLQAIGELVAGAQAHLQPGGWLLLEHGWEQAGQVRTLLQAAGFEQIRTAQDLERRDRVTLGRCRL